MRLLQLAFLGESDPNFPWEKIPIGTTKCTKYKKTPRNTNGYEMMASWWSLHSELRFIVLEEERHSWLDLKQSTIREAL